MPFSRATGQASQGASWNSCRQRQLGSNPTPKPLAFSPPKAQQQTVKATESIATQPHNRKGKTEAFAGTSKQGYPDAGNNLSGSRVRPQKRITLVLALATGNELWPLALAPSPTPSPSLSPAVEEGGGGPLP